jgi:hypothetical protein
MRTYNPVLSTYKTISKQVEEMSHVKEPKKTLSGLLAPKRKEEQKENGMDSPVMRVASHFKILRNKRNEINGS